MPFLEKQNGKDLNERMATRYIKTAATEVRQAALILYYNIA